MDITEIQSVQRQLQHSKDQLETAQVIADACYGELDLRINELLWGEGAYIIWEAEPAACNPTFENFFATIHSDDMAALNSVQEAVLKGEQILDHEHRIVLSNNKIKWVLEKGWIKQNEHGEKEKLVGAVQDITQRKQDEERIAFQAEMLGAVGQAVVATDIEGQVIFWNRAAEDIYGWKAKEVIGAPITTITPTEQTSEEAFRILRRLLNGQSWEGEFEVKDKTGRTFPVYVTDSPVLDDQGNLKAIIGVSTDISKRKEAEKQLAESERKYRLIFENTSIPIWIFERESLRFLEVNHATISKYGYTKEEFLNMTLLDIRDKGQQVLMEDNANQLESGSHQEVITVHRTKAGNQLYVNIYSSVIDYYGTEAELVTAIDISNQVDTEREITNAIMRNTEEERGYIAREIHDGLTQTLSIVSLNLKNLVHDQGQLKDEARYNKALKYLAQAIDQSRTIAHRLMPKTISDFGVVPAIMELVESLTVSTKIDIDFEHDFNDRLAPEVELNLFRIVQEALSNVVAHSGANSVRIVLEKNPEKLHMRLSDNGSGFSVNEKLSSSDGIGLRTMHSRAISLDALLRINSKLGKGTTISIDIPAGALKRK
jgi:PAS domain S-box-containing protein